MAVVSLAAGRAAADEAVGQWRFSGVERVVAVGDVHGAFPELVAILEEAGLISEERLWVGGAAHLVMLGDITDRGPASREALTLIMRLQSEARLAGGRVHALLGNHEVMNLTGDLRYTSTEEFAAFSAEEDPGARKQALKRATHSSIIGNGDLRKIRHDFAKRCPPGYFGHRQAFSPEGLYGRWLLSQQVVVVINDVAFVHGGLPPLLLELEPDAINALAMSQLRDFTAAQHRLAQLGVLAPEMSYAQQIAAVKELAAQRAAVGVSSEAVDLARTMFELGGGLVFRHDGPLWYRGTSLNPEAEERPLVDAVLAHLCASTVVVGHTPSHTTRVAIRFDGRVVMADTGMLASHYEGRPSAVELHSGRLLALYPGEGARVIASQRWELTEKQFSGDADLEAFLRTARVAWTEDVGSGSTRPMQIGLADNGRRAKAVFKAIDADGRSYLHEVAAYRLDRLLGLGMVPPTVLREINGVPGSVQLWVDHAINETDRRSEDLEPDNPIAYAISLNSSKVFDLVIFNIDRTGSNMLITPADWRIHLIDHERAFAAKSPAAPYLADARSRLEAPLEQRLAALDPGTVRAELAGLLGEDQLAALLARVELLLGS
jgi:hypothetical protein